MKPLIIRADASPEIGTGHVMRCLALAEAWLNTMSQVFFVFFCNAPVLEDRLKKEGTQIIHINQRAGTQSDADETVQIAHEYGAEWLIVDGYQFGAEYQKRIKDSGLSLLCIDDYGHADHYYADIVLNQNVYADMSYYPKYEPNTRFLLGTKYVLLRKEFLKRSNRNRKNPDIARKILITLGGGDPNNITIKVIDAVRTIDIDGMEVKVVLGSTNPNFDDIYKKIQYFSNFTLINNASDMQELMIWADLAISAGGSTCWELAYLGTPFVALIIADNQKPVVLGISGQNATINLGHGQILNATEISKNLKTIVKSVDIRTTLSKNSKKLVDGEGVSRVIMHINSDLLRLRSVRQSDCITIWNWANDPVVRESAFNNKYIPIDEHILWFSQKIIDPKIFFFIAYDKDDNPIGQIRFDLSGDAAIVDISIDKIWRSKGYAKHLLNQGINCLLKKSAVTTIGAYIKVNNLNSIKTFLSCDFKFLEKITVRNCETVFLSRDLK